MFDTAPGPLDTMAKLYDYIVDNAALMSEEIRDRLKLINREQDTAKAHTDAVEYLYRACKEDDLLPGRDDALEILGTLAMHVYGINLWNKGARAFQIASWAQSDLSGGTNEGPDLDEQFWFIQPEAPAMLVPNPAP